MSPFLIPARKFYFSTFWCFAVMSSRKAVRELVFIAVFTGMLVVQVYGGSTSLKGYEGNNITLPLKLMESGTLRWNGKAVLVVSNGKVTHRLDERVQWNNSTGEITIINLQRNDAGELILSIRNSLAQAYNLTVDASPTETHPRTPTETPTETPPGTPTETPPGTPSWLVPVVIGVVIGVPVLAGLGYFLCKKAVGSTGPRRNRRPAAAANGHVENDPMMPPGDGTAETSL